MTVNHDVAGSSPAGGAKRKRNANAFLFSFAFSLLCPNHRCLPLQEAAEGGMTRRLPCFTKTDAFRASRQTRMARLRDIVDTCMSNAAPTTIYVILLVPPHANLPRRLYAFDFDKIR